MLVISVGLQSYSSPLKELHAFSPSTSRSPQELSLMWSWTNQLASCTAATVLSFHQAHMYPPLRATIHYICWSSIIALWALIICPGHSSSTLSIHHLPRVIHHHSLGICWVPPCLLGIPNLPPGIVVSADTLPFHHQCLPWECCLPALSVVTCFCQTYSPSRFHMLLHLLQSLLYLCSKN